MVNNVNCTPAIVVVLPPIYTRAATNFIVVRIFVKLESMHIEIQDKVPSSQQQQEEQHQAFLDLTASPLITRGREGNLSRKERRLRGEGAGRGSFFPPPRTLQ